MAAYHRLFERYEPVFRVDLVSRDEVVELHQRSGRDVLRHLEARRADHIRRIGLRAQGARAIRACRIDDDPHLNVGIQPLELRDHLRLCGGARVIGVVRVKERVVGDLDGLREGHGCELAP